MGGMDSLGLTLARAPDEAVIRPGISHLEGSCWTAGLAEVVMKGYGHYFP